MTKEEIQLVLSALVESEYLDQLNEFPHYGAPLFGIQAISESLALCVDSVEIAADHLNEMTASLKGFENYPHSISDTEIECMDGILDESFDAMFSLLAAASAAVRYKRSFGCFK